MATETRYAPGEVVARGRALYESRIRREAEEGNFGKFLVINVETGQWEIGEDQSETALRARAKYPDVGLFGMKIGYPAAAAIGGRLRPLTETAREQSNAEHARAGSDRA